MYKWRQYRYFINLNFSKRSHKENKKRRWVGEKVPTADAIKYSFYFIFRLERNAKKNREEISSRETVFSTPNSATSLYSPTFPNSPNSPNSPIPPNSYISTTSPSPLMKCRQDSVSPFLKECFPAPFLKGSSVLPAPFFKASKASASPVTLKGLSGQIRMTWIWYRWIGNFILLTL